MLDDLVKLAMRFQTPKQFFFKETQTRNLRFQTQTLHRGLNETTARLQKFFSFRMALQSFLIPYRQQQTSTSPMAPPQGLRFPWLENVCSVPIDHFWSAERPQNKFRFPLIELVRLPQKRTKLEYTNQCTAVALNRRNFTFVFSHFNGSRTVSTSYEGIEWYQRHSIPGRSYKGGWSARPPRAGSCCHSAYRDRALKLFRSSHVPCVVLHALGAQVPLFLTQTA